MPSSVLRRRPAQVIPAQLTPEERKPRRLPPVPPVSGRSPVSFIPRRRRLPPVPPVRGRRPVPIGLVAAILLFVGLFVVAMGLGAATNFDLADMFRGPDEPPPRTFPVLEPSPPTRITIPSLKVDAPIMNVAQATDGSVDVPPVDKHNEAGWFQPGPSPGQFGPALIVGHADTRRGPAVFLNLKTMKPGQFIYVRRTDGITAIFKVNSVEHYGKASLPIQRVYGDFSRPSLRLITCGGVWDNTAQSYTDNVIVFASLSGSTKKA